MKRYCIIFVLIYLNVPGRLCFLPDNINAIDNLNVPSPYELLWTTTMSYSNVYHLTYKMLIGLGIPIKNQFHSNEEIASILVPKSMVNYVATADDPPLLFLKFREASEDIEDFTFENMSFENVISTGDKNKGLYLWSLIQESTVDFMNRINYLTNKLNIIEKPYTASKMIGLYNDIFGQTVNTVLRSTDTYAKTFNFLKKYNIKLNMNNNQANEQNFNSRTYTRMKLTEVYELYIIALTQFYNTKSTDNSWKPLDFITWYDLNSSKSILDLMASKLLTHVITLTEYINEVYKYHISNLPELTSDVQEYTAISLKSIVDIIKSPLMKTIMFGNGEMNTYGLFSSTQYDDNSIIDKLVDLKNENWYNDRVHNVLTNWDDEVIKVVSNNIVNKYKDSLRDTDITHNTKLMQWVELMIVDEQNGNVLESSIYANIIIKNLENVISCMFTKNGLNSDEEKLTKTLLNDVDKKLNALYKYSLNPLMPTGANIIPNIWHDIVNDKDNIFNILDWLKRSDSNINIPYWPNSELFDDKKLKDVLQLASVSSDILYDVTLTSLYRAIKKDVLSNEKEQSEVLLILDDLEHSRNTNKGVTQQLKKYIIDNLSYIHLNLENDSDLKKMALQELSKLIKYKIFVNTEIIMPSLKQAEYYNLPESNENQDYSEHFKNMNDVFFQYFLKKPITIKREKAVGLVRTYKRKVSLIFKKLMRGNKQSTKNREYSKTLKQSIQIAKKIYSVILNDLSKMTKANDEANLKDNNNEIEKRLHMAVALLTEDFIRYQQYHQIEEKKSNLYNSRYKYTTSAIDISKINNNLNYELINSIMNLGKSENSEEDNSAPDIKVNVTQTTIKVTKTYPDTSTQINEGLNGGNTLPSSLENKVPPINKDLDQDNNEIQTEITTQTTTVVNLENEEGNKTDITIKSTQISTQTKSVSDEKISGEKDGIPNLSNKANAITSSDEEMPTKTQVVIKSEAEKSSTGENDDDVQTIKVTITQPNSASNEQNSKQNDIVKVNVKIKKEEDSTENMQNDLKPNPNKQIDQSVKEKANIKIQKDNKLKEKQTNTDTDNQNISKIVNDLPTPEVLSKKPIESNPAVAPMKPIPGINNNDVTNKPVPTSSENLSGGSSDRDDRTKGPQQPVSSPGKVMSPPYPGVPNIKSSPADGPMIPIPGKNNYDTKDKSVPISSDNLSGGSSDLENRAKGLLQPIASPDQVMGPHSPGVPDMKSNPAIGPMIPIPGKNNYATKDKSVPINSDSLSGGSSDMHDRVKGLPQPIASPDKVMSPQYPGIPNMKSNPAVGPMIPIPGNNNYATKDKSVPTSSDSLSGGSSDLDDRAEGHQKPVVVSGKKIDQLTSIGVSGNPIRNIHPDLTPVDSKSDDVNMIYKEKSVFQKAVVVTDKDLGSQENPLISSPYGKATSPQYPGVPNMKSNPAIGPMIPIPGKNNYATKDKSVPINSDSLSGGSSDRDDRTKGPQMTMSSPGNVMSPSNPGVPDMKSNPAIGPMIPIPGKNNYDTKDKSVPISSDNLSGGSSDLENRAKGLLQPIASPDKVMSPHYPGVPEMKSNPAIGPMIPTPGKNNYATKDKSVPTSSENLSGGSSDLDHRTKGLQQPVSSPSNVMSPPYPGVPNMISNPAVGPLKPISGNNNYDIKDKSVPTSSENLSGGSSDLDHRTKELQQPVSSPRNIMSPPYPGVPNMISNPAVGPLKPISGNNYNDIKDKSVPTSSENLSGGSSDRDDRTKGHQQPEVGSGKKNDQMPTIGVNGNPIRNIHPDLTPVDSKSDDVKIVIKEKSVVQKSVALTDINSGSSENPLIPNPIGKATSPQYPGLPDMKSNPAIGPMIPIPGKNNYDTKDKSVPISSDNLSGGSSDLDNRTKGLQQPVTSPSNVMSPPYPGVPNMISNPAVGPLKPISGNNNYDIKDKSVPTSSENLSGGSSDLDHRTKELQQPVSSPRNVMSPPYPGVPNMISNPAVGPLKPISGNNNYDIKDKSVPTSSENLSGGSSDLDHRTKGLQQPVTSPSNVMSPPYPGVPNMISNPAVGPLKPISGNNNYDIKDKSVPTSSENLSGGSSDLDHRTKGLQQPVTSPSNVMSPPYPGIPNMISNPAVGPLKPISGNNNYDIKDKSVPTSSENLSGGSSDLDHRTKEFQQPVSSPRNVMSPPYPGVPNMISNPAVGPMIPTPGKNNYATKDNSVPTSSENLSGGSSDLENRAKGLLQPIASPDKVMSPPYPGVPNMISNPAVGPLKPISGNNNYDIKDKSVPTSSENLSGGSSDLDHRTKELQQPVSSPRNVMSPPYPGVPNMISNPAVGPLKPISGNNYNDIKDKSVPTSSENLSGGSSDRDDRTKGHQQPEVGSGKKNDQMPTIGVNGNPIRNIHPDLTPVDSKSDDVKIVIKEKSVVQKSVALTDINSGSSENPLIPNPFGKATSPQYPGLPDMKSNPAIGPMIPIPGKNNYDTKDKSVPISSDNLSGGSSDLDNRAKGLQQPVSSPSNVMSPPYPGVPNMISNPAVGPMIPTPGKNNYATKDNSVPTSSENLSGGSSDLDHRTKGLQQPVSSPSNVMSPPYPGVPNMISNPAVGPMIPTPGKNNYATKDNSVPTSSENLSGGSSDRDDRTKGLQQPVSSPSNVMNPPYPGVPNMISNPAVGPLKPISGNNNYDIKDKSVPTSSENLSGGSSDLDHRTKELQQPVSSPRNVMSPPYPGVPNMISNPAVGPLKPISGNNNYDIKDKSVPTSSENLSGGSSDLDHRTKEFQQPVSSPRNVMSPPYPGVPNMISNPAVGPLKPISGNNYNDIKDKSVPTSSENLSGGSSDRDDRTKGHQQPEVGSGKKNDQMPTIGVNGNPIRNIHPDLTPVDSKSDDVKIVIKEKSVVQKSVALTDINSGSSENPLIPNPFGKATSPQYPGLPDVKSNPAIGPMIPIPGKNNYDTKDKSVPISSDNLSGGSSDLDNRAKGLQQPVSSPSNVMSPPYPGVPNMISNPAVGPMIPTPGKNNYATKDNSVPTSSENLSGGSSDLDHRTKGLQQPVSSPSNVMSPPYPGVPNMISNPAVGPTIPTPGKNNYATKDNSVPTSSENLSGGSSDLDHRTKELQQPVSSPRNVMSPPYPGVPNMISNPAVGPLKPISGNNNYDIKDKSVPTSSENLSGGSSDLDHRTKGLQQPVTSPSNVMSPPYPGVPNMISNPAVGPLKPISGNNNYDIKDKSVPTSSENLSGGSSDLDHRTKEFQQPVSSPRNVMSPPYPGVPNMISNPAVGPMIPTPGKNNYAIKDNSVPTSSENLSGGSSDLENRAKGLLQPIASPDKVMSPPYPGVPNMISNPAVGPLKPISGNNNYDIKDKSVPTSSENLSGGSSDLDHRTKELQQPVSSPRNVMSPPYTGVPNMISNPAVGPLKPISGNNYNDIKDKSVPTSSENLSGGSSDRDDRTKGHQQPEVGSGKKNDQMPTIGVNGNPIRNIHPDRTPVDSKSDDVKIVIKEKSVVQKSVALTDINSGSSENPLIPNPFGKATSPQYPGLPDMKSNPAIGPMIPIPGKNNYDTKDKSVPISSDNLSGGSSDLDNRAKGLQQPVSSPSNVMSPPYPGVPNMISNPAVGPMIPTPGKNNYATKDNSVPTSSKNLSGGSSDLDHRTKGLQQPVSSPSNVMSPPYPGVPNMISNPAVGPMIPTPGKNNYATKDNSVPTSSENLSGGSSDRDDRTKGLQQPVSSPSNVMNPPYPGVPNMISNPAVGPLKPISGNNNYDIKDKSVPTSSENLSGGSSDLDHRTKGLQQPVTSPSYVMSPPYPGVPNMISNPAVGPLKPILGNNNYDIKDKSVPTSSENLSGGSSDLDHRTKELQQPVSSPRNVMSPPYPGVPNMISNPAVGPMIPTPGKNNYATKDNSVPTSSENLSGGSSDLDHRTKELQQPVSSPRNVMSPPYPGVPNMISNPAVGPLKPISGNNYNDIKDKSVPTSSENLSGGSSDRDDRTKGHQQPEVGSGKKNDQMPTIGVNGNPIRNIYPDLTPVDSKSDDVKIVIKEKSVVQKSVALTDINSGSSENPLIPNPFGKATSPQYPSVPDMKSNPAIGPMIPIPGKNNYDTKDKSVPISSDNLSGGSSDLDNRAKGLLQPIASPDKVMSSHYPGVTDMKSNPAIGPMIPTPGKNNYATKDNSVPTSSENLSGGSSDLDHRTKGLQQPVSSPSNVMSPPYPGVPNMISNPAVGPLKPISGNNNYDIKDKSVPTSSENLSGGSSDLDHRTKELQQPVSSPRNVMSPPYPGVPNMISNPAVGPLKPISGNNNYATKDNSVPTSSENVSGGSSDLDHRTKGLQQPVSSPSNAMSPPYPGVPNMISNPAVGPLKPISGNNYNDIKDKSVPTSSENLSGGSSDRDDRTKGHQQPEVGSGKKNDQMPTIGVNGNPIRNIHPDLTPVDSKSDDGKIVIKEKSVVQKSVAVTDINSGSSENPLIPNPFGKATSPQYPDVPDMKSNPAIGPMIPTPGKNNYATKDNSVPTSSENLSGGSSDLDHRTKGLQQPVSSPSNVMSPPYPGVPNMKPNPAVGPLKPISGNNNYATKDNSVPTSSENLSGGSSDLDHRTKGLQQPVSSPSNVMSPPYPGVPNMKPNPAVGPLKPISGNNNYDIKDNSVPTSSENLSGGPSDLDHRTKGIQQPVSSPDQVMSPPYPGVPNMKLNPAVGPLKPIPENNNYDIKDKSVPTSSENLSGGSSDRDDRTKGHQQPVSSPDKVMSPPYPGVPIMKSNPAVGPLKPISGKNNYDTIDKSVPISSDNLSGGSSDLDNRAKGLLQPIASSDQVMSPPYPGVPNMKSYPAVGPLQPISGNNNYDIKDKSVPTSSENLSGGSSDLDHRTKGVQQPVSSPSNVMIPPYPGVPNVKPNPAVGPLKPIPENNNYDIKDKSVPISPENLSGGSSDLDHRAKGLQQPVSSSSNVLSPPYPGVPNIKSNPVVEPMNPIPVKNNNDVKDKPVPFQSDNLSVESSDRDYHPKENQDLGISPDHVIMQPTSSGMNSIVKIQPAPSSFDGFTDDANMKYTPTSVNQKSVGINDKDSSNDGSQLMPILNSQQSSGTPNFDTNSNVISVKSNSGNDVGGSVGITAPESDDDSSHSVEITIKKTTVTTTESISTNFTIGQPPDLQSEGSDTTEIVIKTSTVTTTETISTDIKASSGENDSGTNSLANVPSSEDLDSDSTVMTVKTTTISTTQSTDQTVKTNSGEAIP